MQMSLDRVLRSQMRLRVSCSCMVLPHLIVHANLSVTEWATLVPRMMDAAKSLKKAAVNQQRKPELDNDKPAPVKKAKASSVSEHVHVCYSCIFIHFLSGTLVFKAAGRCGGEKFTVAGVCYGRYA